jgi:translation elongation factor EF-1beta
VKNSLKKKIKETKKKRDNAKKEEKEIGLFGLFYFQ